MTTFNSGMPGMWRAHTPSDSTDITGSIGIYVGTTGDVATRTLGEPSTTVTFSNVPAGAFIPGNFTRVMAATTASDIVVGFA